MSKLSKDIECRGHLSVIVVGGVVWCVHGNYVIGQFCYDGKVEFYYTQLLKP